LLLSYSAIADATQIEDAPKNDPISITFVGAIFITIALNKSPASGAIEPGKDIGCLYKRISVFAHFVFVFLSHCGISHKSPGFE
jgi:hypothetical protein